MKATELLEKQLEENYKNRPFFFGVEKYHKEKIEKFHEALEELEEIRTQWYDFLKWTGR